MQEIERKFLINGLQFKEEAVNSFEIAQGFLNTHPERTVRVRIKGDEGFLTIKGKSNESGTSRFEWEKTISIAEAKQLLQLCEEGIIEKIRYNIPKGNHVFEVDEFFGQNEGLIVAEVELQHEDETFETPSWLGNEVTGQKKYYNSQLSKKPYKTWHYE
ncbi:CYTH domain-containing protein [uncultured Kordia sp.]|uniref:CYTH domain-containing protein n=1 Tax=uncultured Kordia sp. TaxID=507699 RepID=UPI00260CC11B|nr:CYTH domain-containing protein [uncultured Kordia sp.]